tara:strand:- start:1581 stop:1832 length:252 start_codon:yes stop_codon:yes gene_type:complete
MQSKAHEALTKQISLILDPKNSYNWESLIAASKAPDWGYKDKSGMGHHRRREAMEDDQQIIKLVRDARTLLNFLFIQWVILLQ